MPARCQARVVTSYQSSFLVTLVLTLMALLLQAVVSQAWGEELICHAHLLPVGSASDQQTLLTPGPLATDQPHLHPMMSLKATLDVDCAPTPEAAQLPSVVTSADQDRLQRLGLGQVPPPPPATSVSLAPPPLTTRAANTIRLSSDWRNWACIGAAFSRQF